MKYKENECEFKIEDFEEVSSVALSQLPRGLLFLLPARILTPGFYYKSQQRIHVSSCSSHFLSHSHVHVCVSLPV